MLSIVIPIHNEELILESEMSAMNTALKQNLPDLNYEVLLVENGSRDRTLEIAQQISNTMPEVRVVSLASASYGGAVKEGILRAGGDLIAILNIDFWDIEFIKKALDILAYDKYDIVLGSKTMGGAKDLRPWTRRWITAGLNAILHLVFNFKGTDTHGMKMFSREKVAPIAGQCLTEREIFDTEMILRAQYQGLKTKEVPVICVEKRPSTLIAKNPMRILKLGWRTIRDLTIVFFSTRGVYRKK